MTIRTFYFFTYILTRAFFLSLDFGPFACTRLLLLVHSPYWADASLVFIQLKTQTQDAKGLRVSYSKRCICYSGTVYDQKSLPQNNKNSRRRVLSFSYGHLACTRTAQTILVWSLNLAPMSYFAYHLD